MKDIYLIQMGFDLISDDQSEIKSTGRQNKKKEENQRLNGDFWQFFW